MPNPWDIGSALVLESLGFVALATTSSGHAATLGRLDQNVSREELLVHVSGLTGRIGVPLNVDAERCFPKAPGGVAETVRLLAEAGAAGCSIEDYDPFADTIEPVEIAAERVATASEAAGAHGLVLTARAENHVHGLDDLDDTISRLAAYREAGADVAYAPGLEDLGDIARLVKEVGAPVNVLARHRGPSVAELRSVGVRRISTGGTLLRASYGALVSAARELLEKGTSTYASGVITESETRAAFVGENG